MVYDPCRQGGSYITNQQLVGCDACSESFGLSSFQPLSSRRPAAHADPAIHAVQVYDLARAERDEV